MSWLSVAFLFFVKGFGGGLLAVADALYFVMSLFFMSVVNVWWVCLLFFFFNFVMKNLLVLLLCGKNCVYSSSLSVFAWVGVSSGYIVLINLFEFLWMVLLKLVNYWIEMFLFLFEVLMCLFIFYEYILGWFFSGKSSFSSSSDKFWFIKRVCMIVLFLIGLNVYVEYIMLLLGLSSCVYCCVMVSCVEWSVLFIFGC